MKFKAEDALSGLKNCVKKCCYDCPFKEETPCKLIMMTAAANAIEKLQRDKAEIYEDIADRIRDMVVYGDRMVKASVIIDEIDGMRRKADD